MSILITLPASEVSVSANRPHSRHVAGRGAVLAALLTAEIVTVAALGHPWLPTHQATAGPIVFLASFAFFGRRRLPFIRQDYGPIHCTFAALHAAALISALTLQLIFLHTTPTKPFMVGWASSLAALPITLLLTMVPGRTLIVLTRTLGPAWAYAAVCTFLVLTGKALELAAWDAPNSPLGNALANLTFRCVRLLLHFVTPALFSDPATRILGTPTFLIRVAGSCSGIEGLALTFVFTCAWLCIERHQLRLTRAIWLIPASLLLIWTLNTIRIATLILIGASGHPQVATTGFHTEAGWIIFISTALAFLLISNRLPALHLQRKEIRHLEQSTTLLPHNKPSKDPDALNQPQTVPSLGATTLKHAHPHSTPNPAVPYLLPVAAILATSLLTRAFSTGFETLYPFRLLAAAVPLIAFRRFYRTLPWSFCPFDLLGGILLGLLWIRFTPSVTPEATTLAAGLAHLTPNARTLWLTARTLAAVLTVPVAEELAFRGFLARILTAKTDDPTSILFRTLTPLAIVLSSLAFGLLHSQWILATLAGVVFALLARRRNSLGAPLVAHTAANATLAAAALLQHNYSLW